MSKIFEWLLVAFLHVAGAEFAAFIKELDQDAGRKSQLDVITDPEATREQKASARRAIVGGL